MITIVYKFPKVIHPHRELIVSPVLVIANISSETEIPQDNEILEFAEDVVLRAKEFTGRAELFGNIYHKKPMIVVDKRRELRWDKGKLNHTLIINLATSL